MGDPFFGHIPMHEFDIVEFSPNGSNGNNFLIRRHGDDVCQSGVLAKGLFEIGVVLDPADLDDLVETIVGSHRDAIIMAPGLLNDFPPYIQEAIVARLAIDT